MKAMVFAAGLGTRLRPITDTMPKALVPVCGKPLLYHTIRKLRDAGYDEIVVNIHHFPEQIRKYLADNDFGVKIDISDDGIVSICGVDPEFYLACALRSPFCGISKASLKSVLRLVERNSASGATVAERFVSLSDSDFSGSGIPDDDSAALSRSFSSPSPC